MVREKEKKRSWILNILSMIFLLVVYTNMRLVFWPLFWRGIPNFTIWSTYEDADGELELVHRDVIMFVVEVMAATIVCGISWLTGLWWVWSVAIVVALIIAFVVLNVARYLMKQRRNSVKLSEEKRST